MSAGQRCLMLAKGRHRFVFTCAEGRDAELLDAFVSLARDRHSAFDWFDAAALWFQMNRPADAAEEAVVGTPAGQRDD